MNKTERIADCLETSGIYYEKIAALDDSLNAFSLEDECAALESIEDSKPPKSNDDIIANLVRRVAELEREVKKLKEKPSKVTLDIETLVKLIGDYINE